MHQELVKRTPLVAILRGLEPDRSADVGSVLLEAGIDVIEVPLNSPDPFRSIAAMVNRIGERALIGAGTVLRADDVDLLAEIGARLVVSPNCDPAVISRTAQYGMVSFPGVLTPTEMFAAIQAGASALKVFPAELMPPAGVRAVRAVLPPDLLLYVVGGIHAGNMADYLAAGASGFGLGGSLFKPGKPLADIARDATAIVDAFNSARAGQASRVA